MRTIFYPFRYIFIICACSIITQVGIAQNSYQTTKALNNYVHFSNESIHGLLIIHRLLAGFNTTINKYVDLPNQQINFYSNQNLPADIFEDKDKEFYTTSPNVWYTLIQQNKDQLKSHNLTEANHSVDQMKSILVSLNQMRFDLDNMIVTLDLKKRENLSQVYDKLEEAVTLYASFYESMMRLETNINQVFNSLPITSSNETYDNIYRQLEGLYKPSRIILDALYHKKEELVEANIDRHEKSLQNIQAIDLTSYNSSRLNNSRVNTFWNNIVTRSKEAIGAEKEFLKGESIPEEYVLYDRYFYFYNISIINKFNRYGMGIVHDINRIMDYINHPGMRFFEMPHYFKVIYPKILEKTEMLTASDPKLVSLPKKVRDREVVVADRKIFVDSSSVEFSIYDHKIIDNDIVSLSFNGDWILEHYTISNKPYKFKIDLNKEGYNYLLLHAEDVGRNPPASIAVSYFYNGKKKTILLNSDEKKSEIIEIVVDK